MTITPNDLTNESVKDLLRRVFLGNEDGRKALDFIVNYCMVFNSTFSSDPMEMAFKDGTRSVALRLLNMLEYNTSEVITEERLNKGFGKWKSRMSQ